MTWFNVDDQSAFHEKVVRAGNEAWGAVCRAGAWSAARGTDGLIPSGIANLIASATVWDRARDAGGPGRPGLIEYVDGGILLHDYLDCNDSAAEIESKRAKLHEKRSRAGLAGNLKRWGKRSQPSQTASQDASGLPSQNGRNSSPIPIPIPSTDTSYPVDAPAPPPPVLTNPEPEAPKARKPRQAKLPVAKPNTALGWGIWREMYQSSKRGYGRYIPSPADNPAMAEIIRCATEAAAEEAKAAEDPNPDMTAWTESVIRSVFVGYLRTDGHNGFLCGKRHAVMYAPREFGVYLAAGRNFVKWPKRSDSPKPAPVALPEQIPASVPGSPPSGFDATLSTMFSAPGGVN